MTRKRHPRDKDAVPLPPSLTYLWQYFWDLNAGRPVSQAGYLPLPAVEIYAWQQVNRIALTRWELNAVRQMDSAFIKVMADMEK
jgi:hypothetical protein